MCFQSLPPAISSVITPAAVVMSPSPMRSDDHRRSNGPPNNWSTPNHRCVIDDRLNYRRASPGRYPRRSPRCCETWSTSRCKARACDRCGCSNTRTSCCNCRLGNNFRTWRRRKWCQRRRGLNKCSRLGLDNVTGCNGKKHGSTQANQTFLHHFSPVEIKRLGKLGRLSPCNDYLSSRGRSGGVFYFLCIILVQLLAKGK